VIVAIDGPAGAGKGTVARALAAALGWRYVDTGAMYRAVALAVLQEDVDPGDEGAVVDIARRAGIGLDDDAVYLDGNDVTDLIRTPEVTNAVSTVAAYPGVRAALVTRQRELMATTPHVVVEGRDIGTTVAPDAAVKVFLTASPRERALRRVRQLGLDEDPATLDAVQRDITTRDGADATRDASPFRQALDAVVVDSTSRTIEEVVEEVTSLVRAAR
jgi:CMP/dCMP kinase